MNDNRIRRTKKLKTEKKNGLSLFNHLAGISSTLRSKNGTSFLNDLFSNDKKKANFSSEFEVIDNDKLKFIFDSYKNIINNQHTMDNSIEKTQSNTSQNTFMQNRYHEQRKNFLEKNQKNFYMNKHQQKEEENIPNYIKERLNLQTRKLKLMKSSELKNIKMSKYLSKKVNKPLDNLLLNRIDSFRFKSFINLSEERYLPLWSLIIEKSPRLKNLSVKPDYVLSEGEIHEFQKQAYNLKRININNIDENTNPYFQTVENLDKIIVKGKNLYNVEYKREILDNKNKKIWHKVFMENGKATSLADINKIFGDETFYKDYDGCITEKNIYRNYGCFNLKDFIKKTL